MGWNWRVDSQLSFSELITALRGGGFPGEPQGGFRISNGENFFVPPELLLRESFGSLAAPVVLVSARGAAGKSSLAEKLSHSLNVPLWRLEDDKAVGATSLSFAVGQYLRTADVPGALKAASDPMILIDSLDEARARVSGTSWQEFLESIAEITRHGCRFVLFGRERTLEEVWLSLADVSVDAGWLEISHFGESERCMYVDEVVSRRSGPLTIKGEYYQPARDAVLASLVSSVSGEAADTFAGYPPVLDAVAAVLLQRNNHFDLAGVFGGTKQGSQHLEELQRLLEDLLRRDQKKMAPLAADLGLDPAAIYTPLEQLQWLCHELEGGPEPDLTHIREKVRGDYIEGIRRFLNDHPFRDERRWASTVFAAYTASQLFGTTISGHRLIEIGNGSSLLFDLVALQPAPVVDESGFAALHASVVAGEFGGALATVTVSEVSDVEYGVTMELFRPGESSGKAFTMIPDDEGSLHLLGPLKGLQVETSGKLTIPARQTPTVLGPDVFLHCSALTIEGPTVEFAHRVGEQDAGVTIEVTTPQIHLPARISRDPRPGDFELYVADNVSLVYPWVNYRKTLETPDSYDPTDRAVRFLKMFMNLTRAHGHHGERGTFIKKFQGRQGLKGADFQAAVDVLKERGIARVNNEMIYLREEWEKHRFSGKTITGQRPIEDVWAEWGPVAEEIGARIGQV